LRARLQSTQLEDLSDASFLGKLLVLPANVRLDWKVFAIANTLVYLASSSATKEKSFITLTPGIHVEEDFSRQKSYKTFFLSFLLPLK
jgi:hypothetical protein